MKLKLKHYVILWFHITLLLAFESIQLNSGDPGILSTLSSAIPQLKDLNLSPEPGRPISLYLGWTGFTLMLITNLYILRKRLSFLKNLGRAAGWLDFHIFCGLMGPTLIIFHTNFKVRGLVSISFWSMMTVAISGVVGRYFYGQVVRKKTELVKEAESAASVLDQLLKTLGRALAPEQLQALKAEAARWVGCRAALEGTSPGMISTLFASAVGDTRLLLRMLPPAAGVPMHGREMLRNYGLALRRSESYESFQRFLGYWHAFHLPFAFFMYLVAVIHIISALLFGV